MALDFVTDHKGSGTMEIKVIVDQLSSYEITPVAEAEKNTYIETHKMIKPGQTSFYPACLYVGYASDLPDALESAANIIAIEDEPVPPSFSQAPGLNLYLAPCGTSQFDILNRIADIMIDEAAIVAGMRRLIDALYSGAGLQAIVDIASDVMGNPVFVNDGSFKILAMSQSAVFRNISLEEERALGFVTEQNVADMRRDGIVTRRRHDRENTLRVERPESTEQWLFKDVKLHNVWVATVAIVDNNRPFREPFDMEMIERLSKIVAVELEKNDFFKDDRSVMKEYFLGDLLTDKMQSDHVIEERRRLIGWQSRRYFQVAVVVTRNGAMSHDLARFVTGRLRRILPDCCWTMKQQNIVVLASDDAASVLSSNQRQQLQELLASHDLLVGVSNSFEHLSECRGAFKQAYRAAEAGITMGAPNQTLLSYEDMAPYYIAQTVLKRNDASAFMPNTVERLIAYDEVHGSDLTATLRAFLAYPDDSAKAAESLNIHRNTFLYRMGRIREISGSTLDKGRERFSIQLYFLLHDFQHRSWEGASS